MVYLGGNRVATTQDSDGHHWLHVAWATGLERSDKNASVEGIPVCLYDLPDGAYALGVVQVPSSMLENEHRYTVWQGSPFALRSRPFAPGHALGYISKSNAQKAATTSLYGHPIAINRDDALIGVKVTTPIVDVAFAYIGGVPIICVKSGGRWHLGMCDGSTVPGSVVQPDSPEGDSEQAPPADEA